MLKTVFVASALVATAAQADNLLIVDLTVPDTVTITATDGLAANSAIGSDSIGVYFENFYNTGGGLSDSLVLGDLRSAANTSDGTPDLFRFVDDPGLNFWSWTADVDSVFTAGEVAFAGSATWTVSPDDYAAMLAGNAGGDLYFPADSVDDVPGATFLGTYKVIVPAPGVASVLGLGLLGLARRRR